MGRTHYFESHNVCGKMYDHIASGSGSRFHMRIRRTYHSDDTWGITSTAEPHHEDLVYCTHGPDAGLFGHAVDKNGDNGSGFDQGRRKVRDKLGPSAHHNWDTRWWGNTRDFQQCDGDWAGSNGYTTWMTVPAWNH